MKTKDIKDKLGHYADVVSVRNGIYTVKKSYFWGCTKDGSELALTVQTILPKVKVVDYGNHFHRFVGGAKPGTAKDSYYYCKFKFLCVYLKN